MTSKLSPHVIGWTNSEALLDFIGKTQPAVIKVMGSNAHDTAKMAEAKRRSPNSLWLHRHYVDHQPLDNPTQNALDFFELLKPYLDQYDLVEGYNEPPPFSVDDWKRINEFTVTLSEKIQGAGKKSVAFCWSNGQPPNEAWNYLKDGLGASDYLSLHQYGWPTMSGCPQFTLRYREIYNLLPIKKPLILSEVGMTQAVFGGPDLGWRHWVSPVGMMRREDQAATEWAWLSDEINKDSYVIAANMYTTGRLEGDNWSSHDLTMRLYKLVGDYIVGHPSLAPQPAPAPPTPQPAPPLQPSPAPPIPSGSYAKFERPENDNGQGIHLPGEVGPARMPAWIKSCQETKMTWAVVQCPDKNIGAKAIKAIRQAGIMPIARPYTLINLFMDFGEQARAAIEAGTKYVQIYNEPWDSREWRKEKRPDDWWEIYKARWLMQAQRVRAAGGYPGLQLGGLDRLRDMLRWVKGQGQADIFTDAFFALHLYPGACPPSCTQHEDDALGFLKYAQVFQEEIGFVPPIIVTEWAWSPSEGKPEYYLEVYDWFRTGQLSNGEPLPDYLFAFCAWILADSGGFGWNYPFYVPVVEGLKAKEPFLRWQEKEELMPLPELPEGMIHALDVSEWGGWHTETEWKQAYEAGFRMAIVQAWGGGPSGLGKNPYCAESLKRAREAGMMTAIYLVVPPDTTTLTHSLIQAGRDAAGDEFQYIKFFALDIEGDKLLHPTEPAARLADALCNIKDKPAIVYSSAYMWSVVMGDKPEFYGWPLWDARYDELPDLDANWVAYGGWKERAIKQYKGTTIVAGGISADLNVVHLGRLFGTAEPEEDWKTKYEAATKEAEEYGYALVAIAELAKKALE